MKILYHHRTQGKGAEGVHIREIIKAWRKMGHEVFIVSPPGIDVFKDEKGLENSSKNSGLSQFWAFLSRHVPQIVFEIMGMLYNFSAKAKIKQILNKEKIDFIYERYAFFCWAGVKSAKKANIPIIMEVNEISGIKRVRGQILKNIAKKIETNNFRSADAVVVVSDYLKQRIAETGIDSNKIHVIPNGVNPDVFNPDVDCSEIVEKYRLRDKVVVGFAGGFVKWHNFDLLFSAFTKAKEQTDKKICLFLVGDGPLREKLKQKAIDLDLIENVVFVGKVPHEQVPKYIKVMDICVIPESNEFRSPIKLFEYMAMGKPVIAPRLPPLLKVVNDREDVMLFSLRDQNDLQRVLIDLIGNKGKRDIIGEKAKMRVLKNYLWMNNAVKVIDVVLKQEL